MCRLLLQCTKGTRRCFMVAPFHRRGLAASLSKISMGKTFELQDKLPSLPVPPLAQTCENYLDSVKPLLTREEFLHTQFVVNEFASGVGKELQKKLESRGKNMRNWLETWWEEVAYLSSRFPSAPLINIGGPVSITDIWPVQHGTQITRSALMAHALLLIWQKLYRQEVPVEKMGSDVPLCMFQFSRIFSCCKIPGKEKDCLRSSFLTAPQRASRHIIVQTKGRIFCCTVLDEKMDPISPLEIEQQLLEIQSLTDVSAPGQGIGSLTGEERNVWHELRERLISLNRINEKNLDIIETSLFALVLDEASPVSNTETIREAVVGDCTNRWFDKSFSMLAFRSGLFGVHCDHAPFDGIAEITVVIQACEYLSERGGEWKGSKEIKNYYKPEELVFTVDEVISGAVRQAVKKYQETASVVDVSAYQAHEYGKSFIKTFRIHPDTYVQMAIQLAYYKVHGKPAPTYESAHTRQFYHGRTETVRSCTVESTVWCKAMTERSTDNATKLRLLLQACKKHEKLMKEALKGQGIDRHLLGLQLIAASEGIPTPAIFVDKAWAASGGGGNFVLSTSCAGFQTIFGGCAAMVTDGYGAFYSVDENDVNFFIATFKNSKVTDGTKFKNALGESLRDMRSVLLSSKL